MYEYGGIHSETGYYHLVSMTTPLRRSPGFNYFFNLGGMSNLVHNLCHRRLILDKTPTDSYIYNKMFSKKDRCVIRQSEPQLILRRPYTCKPYFLQSGSCRYTNVVLSFLETTGVLLPPAPGI